MFATAGTGTPSDTDESDGTDESNRTDESSETDFTAGSSDGWYTFRANRRSTRSVSAAHEPDLPDGVAWRYDGVEAPDGIAISDGRVYRRDGTGRIHALDAADGSLQWVSENLGAEVGALLAPVVIGDRVYMGGDALTALDAETGDVRWTQEFGNTDGSLTVYQPEFAFGTIYVGTDDGHLYAVDPSDGSIVWQRYSVDGIDEGDSPFGRYDTFHAVSLAVTDDAVYATVGILDDRLWIFALDPETGETLWMGDPDSGIPRARVGATEKYVFIYNPSGWMNFVDATTGEVVSSVPSGGSPVAIANDVFIASSSVDEQELRAMDLETCSGQPTTRWTVDDADRYGDVAIAGDTVVVLTFDEDDEFLKGFDIRNGHETWCLPLDDVSRSYDLAIHDGTIYFSTDDEQLAIR